jgi:hypothetical protein
LRADTLPLKRHPDSELNKSFRRFSVRDVEELTGHQGEADLFPGKGAELLASLRKEVSFAFKSFSK